MSANPLSGVLERLRFEAVRQNGAGMTDGQLLGHFLSRRDEAAFEALVRRHGPMVLGVCRRILHSSEDAEDAFQATFLVLVRKAASIHNRELLGNWLYGVAYRTALDARSAAARRRTRERQVTCMPEPATLDRPELGHELRAILDQELNRLPEQYRAAVVLCDLEGRSRRDAAQQLGIPTGTLSGRLTSARRILAKRLKRRGLALSAGALAVIVTPSAASANLPAPLVSATVHAAMALAAGQAAAGVCSANVAALTKGALKAMLISKLKTVAALALAAITLATLALFATEPFASESPAFLPARIMKTERGADTERGTAMAPRVLKLNARGRRVIWSPDGKSLAVVTKVEKTLFGFKYDGNGSAIQLWDVEKSQVSQTLAESALGGLAFQHVAFAPDGERIAATVCDELVLPNSRQIRNVVKVWNAKTGTLQKTLGDDDAQLVCLAYSPDSKLLAAGDPAKKAVALWNTATGKLEQTLQTAGTQPWSLAFSADGKTLALGGQKDNHSGQVQLWDTQKGVMRRAWESSDFVNAVVYSPNGRMIASAGGGGTIAIWGVEQGDIIALLKGHSHGHRTVAFSPDNKTIAAGAPDGKVRLWNLPTGMPLDTLTGHESEVFSIAFSPDGRTLASVSQDQTLRLWTIGRPGGEKK